MLVKMEYPYDDIKDWVISKYRNQRENLNNNNIQDFNDYITDEEMGAETFKNEVHEFLNVLCICVALVELKLKDQYFFDKVVDMIKKYKEGYYDAYLSTGENKTDIDTDTAIVEQYIKLQ
jgi:hypothetical protein